MRHLLAASAVIALVGFMVGCSSSKLSRNAASPMVAALIYEAESHIGTAYCSGGATSDCFDCSGFVTTCFTAIGITLPRTSRDIAGIDLRLPDRVTVRLSDEAAQARDDALKPKTKKKGGSV